jgi:hypothetical protein
MKLIGLAIISVALSACQKDSPSPGTATAPTAQTVGWDDPAKAGGIDWPMPGAEANPAVGASAFSRGGSNQGALAIWKRLSKYGGSFLKHWRQSLDSADMPSHTDVVDAFNELALAVTGPTGFWRKTVPNRWFGCEAMADSAPCKKLSSMYKELEQWDAIQKQIESLEGNQATQFLARNEARISLYLDTYVPAEPSADAMRTTPFYQKHLASVLDTMAGQPAPTNNDDL